MRDELVVRVEKRFGQRFELDSVTAELLQVGDGLSNPLPTKAARTLKQHEVEPVVRCILKELGEIAAFALTLTSLTSFAAAPFCGKWMYTRDDALCVVRLIRGLLPSNTYYVTEFALDEANEAVIHASAHKQPFKLTVIRS